MQKLYYARAISLWPKLDKGLQLRRTWRQLRRAKLVNSAEYDGHPAKRADTAGFCLQFSMVGMWLYLVIYLEKIADGVEKKSIKH
jgi:hypothetical protein